MIRFRDYISKFRGYSDRYTLGIVLLIISSGIFVIVALNQIHLLEREKRVLDAQLREIQELRKSLTEVKGVVETMERRIGLTEVRGVVSALEQMLGSLGIKAKSIKTLGENRVNGFIEEDAEVEIEGLDLNKVVNILYRIEHSPAPLKLKGLKIRTTFEDPNMFILNFKASLISRG